MFGCWAIRIVFASRMISSRFVFITSSSMVFTATISFRGRHSALKTFALTPWPTTSKTS